MTQRESPASFDAGNLRDDAEHWDAVAARVAMVAMRPSHANGFAWIARSRGALIAASLLLVTALTLVILPVDSAAARRTFEWTATLAPDDETGQAITVAGSPPAVVALLMGAEEAR
jgi:hypothetical protein